MYKKLALAIVTLCMLAMRAGNSGRRWLQYSAMGDKLGGTAMSTFAEKDYVRYVTHWATTFNLYDTTLYVEALEVNKCQKN